MSVLSGSPGAESRDFIADRGDSGCRLDQVVVRHLADLPELSRTEVSRWIREGRVQVNGEQVRRTSRKLRKGQRVAVARPPRASDPPPIVAQPVPLDVIWEDADMMVLHKSAGVVVHPTWGHRYGTILNGLAWRARDESESEMRPRLVHRLDKNTSGLLMVAKSRKALAALGRALQRREVEKQYLAVAYGKPGRSSGWVRLPIARDPEDPKKRTTRDPAGRVSETHWRLIASAPGDAGPSLFCCRPRTGRTHQIRVHLASLGHPIVGDHLYGLADRSRKEKGTISFPRQALHAWKLRLRHPISGEALEFTAAPPPDFIRLLSEWGLDLDAKNLVLPA